MRDDEIIERFEKWQAETEKYQGLDLSKVEYLEVQYDDEKKFKFIKGLNKYIRKSIKANPGEIPVCGASLDNECISARVTPLDKKDIVPANSVSFNKDNAKGSRAFFRDYKFVMDRHHIAIVPNSEFVDPKYLSIALDYLLKSNNYGWGENVASEAEIKEYRISIPKDFNAKFDSLTIQKAIAEFIEYYSNDKSYKLELVHQIKDRYEQIELGIIPWTLAQTDTLNERFNSFCNENGLELNLDGINFEEEILDNVSHIIPGQSPTGDKLNKNELGIPFHQGKTLYGKKYILPAKVWTEHPKKIASKNDILVSMRAPAGALNIASYDLAIGRGLSAVRPKENVSLDYLYFVLKSNELKIKFSGDKGGIFSSITKGQLQELEVLIPEATNKHSSQYIQEVIAQFLTTYFNKFNEVDDAITRLNFALPNITSVFIKKVFLGMKNSES